MAANQKFVAVFLMFMVALSSMQLVPVSANFMESRSTTFKASDVEGAPPTLVASKKLVPVSANFMESRSTTFKASDVEGAPPTLVASKKVAAEQDTVVDPMMSKNT
nr:hypothetical protein Itr_chr13CG20050 [Ipomoea trifida]